MINIGNTAKLTIKKVSKELELYTFNCEYYCLNIQLGFQSDAVYVIFNQIIKKNRKRKGVYIDNIVIHNNFLKKVLSVFASTDKEL